MDLPVSHHIVDSLPLLKDDNFYDWSTDFNSDYKSDLSNQEFIVPNVAGEKAKLQYVKKLCFSDTTNHSAHDSDSSLHFPSRPFYSQINTANSGQHLRDKHEKVKDTTPVCDLPI